MSKHTSVDVLTCLSVSIMIGTIWLFHNFIRLDLFSAKILMTSSKSMHSASYIDFIVIPMLKFPNVGIYLYQRCSNVFSECQIKSFFIFRGPDN